MVGDEVIIGDGIIVGDNVSVGVSASVGVMVIRPLTGIVFCEFEEELFTSHDANSNRKDKNQIF
jgi:acetyltransferase-like isoleucine patch superfamily enzyme